MDLAAPKTIGKYEVLGILGRGGMGVVYRAQDPRMGRQVAIKTLTAGLTNDAGMLGRFYREAEKMGMLKHPNIITVYDLGEQSGFPYIVMEFVEGEPLDRTVREGKTVALIDKLRILEQVCAALGYAHHHDVVHRDVKPANVIVRPDGVAKLLDFGIARQENNQVDKNFTSAGGVIGTVPYMAPERLRGGAIDGRSDIFATGVMLFQLLTGRLPFLGEDVALINQLLHERHPPLRSFGEGFPDALEAVVERSLAKDPGERYQAAEEMAADLSAIVETLKKDHVEQLLAQAEKQAAEVDYTGARETLMQLVRANGQHPRARKLLGEVNEHINLKAVAAQAQKKQMQAREASRERRHDDAVALLEAAAKLVPEDAGIAEELAAARANKEVNDRVVGYLRQADTARRAGDFEAARLVVEQALELDGGNSRLRAAYQALVRQAEEAAKKAQAKKLLEAATAALERREFARVLDLAGQAEETDPSSAETQAEAQTVSAAAHDAVTREERRGVLEEIEAQVSTGLTIEDVRRLAELVRAALDKSPGDATLLRYQAQFDRQTREFENKRRADEAVIACRASMNESPEQALAAIRQGLKDFPGEERLIRLEASVLERLARKTDEERRTYVLLEAREALGLLNFSQAVMVLEACPENLSTPEIRELLEFAQEEDRRDRREKRLAGLYTEARRLLEREEYELVEKLLGPEDRDTGLQGLLGQAREGLGQQREEVDAAMRLMRSLLETGAHEQLLGTIKELPPRIAEAPTIQEVLASSRRAWHWEATQYYKMGQAYGNGGDATFFEEEIVGKTSLAEFCRRLAERRVVPPGSGRRRVS